MKSISLRHITLLLVGAASLTLTSCATTGDPTTGGIFWSEDKAQDRLDERQARLERIEGKTAATQRRSAATQSEIDKLR
jgi:hypothetical protein